eukprot:scaffold123105_cov30-Tisochrysis_lutea.AAC.5
MLCGEVRNTCPVEAMAASAPSGCFITTSRLQRSRQRPRLTRSQFGSSFCTVGWSEAIAHWPFAERRRDDRVVLEDVGGREIELNNPAVNLAVRERVGEHEAAKGPLADDVAICEAIDAELRPIDTAHKFERRRPGSGRPGGCPVLCGER